MWVCTQDDQKREDGSKSGKTKVTGMRIIVALEDETGRELKFLKSKQ